MEQNLFRVKESDFVADKLKNNYSRLNQDIHVDLAIIGGGITGITLAYLLKHSGQKVAVFEKDCMMQERLSKNISQLVPMKDLIYHKLMHTKSPGKAKKYAEASKEAINFMQETIKKEHIDCDFVEVPAYIYTAEEKDVKSIWNELRACKRLGIEVEYREELPAQLPVKAALMWKEAALFETVKYSWHLAQSFIGAGGKIYEQTEICTIRPLNSNLEKQDLNSKKEYERYSEVQKEKLLLITDCGRKVFARDVVITCKNFIQYEGILEYPEVEKKCSIITAVELNASKLPRGSFNCIDSYQYWLRPNYENRLMLIGSRLPSDCNMEERQEEMAEFIRSIFNMGKIQYCWMNEEYSTYDGMPYVGWLNNDRNLPIYIAAGINGNKTVEGTSAALALRDKLLMDKSEYEDLFNPNRRVRCLF